MQKEKNNILILDCTLRDGGYYNSWDFNRDFVRKYLQIINIFKIRKIEIGYVSFVKDKFYGPMRYCSSQIINYVREYYDGEIGVMIDAKEIKNVDKLNKIINPIDKEIDFFRIAIAPENCIQFKSIIEKSNLDITKTCINIMRMHLYFSDDKFIEKLFENYGRFSCISFVDSYGTMFPDDIFAFLDNINNIKITKKVNIPIGFHPHNNLNLAFANTLEALKNNIDIVDSTISGFGRGAGNLQTELLACFLNKNNSKENIDLDNISHLIEEFEYLRSKLGWGYSFSYMLTGLYQKYPDYINEAKSKLTSINKALNKEKPINKKLNNINLIKFDDFIKNLIPDIFNEINYIIIGGGSQIKERKEDICSWINSKKNNLIIFTSAKYIDLSTSLNSTKILCWNSNEEYRLNQIYRSILKDKNLEDRKLFDLIISNENINFIETEINQKSFDFLKINPETKFSDNIQPSCFLFAIYFIINLKVKLNLEKVHVNLIGMDGYGDLNKPLDKFVHNKNQNLLNELKLLYPEIILTSLTPTLYSNIKEGTIYG